MMRFTASSLTNTLALVTLLAGVLLQAHFAHAGGLLRTIGMYAFSGSITNWLAVYMLFERVPFLYGSGVIPARFQEFKASIRGLLMEQFFRSDIIERLLGDSHTSDSLADSLRERVDFDKVFDRLVEAILESSFGGMVKMFGGADALEGLRPSVKAKLATIMEETISEATSGTEHNPSLLQHLQSSAETLIDARLEELTADKVKELVQQIIREHLGWLVVWGGVFGALLGAAAWGMEALL